MSRLESNAEPSMEEILASIRKIIAEDSSGMRPASVPPRPGTPYSPAPKSVAPQPSPSPSPTPQRGFMSREAFLKSSPPAEPEPRREAFSPVATPRSSGGNNGISAPTSRLQPRDDIPSFAKPSQTLREREIAPPVKDPVRTQDDMRSKEPVLPGAAKEEAKPLKLEVSEPERPSNLRTGTISADARPTSPKVETSTVETIEVVAIEDALAVVKEDSPSVLKAQAVPAVTSSAKSDAASIEAQLTELLSEDLNALRQGRAKTDDRSDTPQQAVHDAPAEPENSDPFAFDLGPSPFAPKPEPQRPALSGSGTQSSSAATSAPVMKLEPAKPEPVKPEPAKAEPARPESVRSETESTPSHPPASAEEQSAAPARPNADEPGVFPQNTPSNAPYFGPFVPAIFAAPSSASTGEASLPKSEAEAAAQRQRQSFVVPSVSATLGPSRKLEPLSNAFQPAPAPPPPVLETFSPAPEAAPELPRAQAPAGWVQDQHPREPQQPSEPRVSQGRRGEPEHHTTLPATFDSSFDRPMEDAVADLLRPLLKTWLAENMPKIVERALRREMSERLLPDQKNSRE